MSDLERVLTEAQRAREEAEAATRRAAELEAQVEAAREQARREREERRREWAQRTLDTYEADLQAAEDEIVAAREKFATVAVEEFARAAEAYLAWGQAAIRHYTLQVRIETAAPVAGFEATPAEFAAPPPFSRALDEALGGRLGELSDQARDQEAAEVERALGGGTPDAGPVSADGQGTEAP